MNAQATPENRADEAAKKTTEEERIHAKPITDRLKELAAMSPEEQKAYQDELIRKAKEKEKKQKVIDGLTRPKQSKKAKQDNARYGRVPLEGRGPITPPHALMRCVDDVESKPICWLWPGRIPCGKLTILSGDPGLGKSQVTIALAGIVTTGGIWPVDNTPCEKGSVIFISSEDDVADTIRPRLEAVGADLSRCHILDAIQYTDKEGNVRIRPFSLIDDLDKLEAEIKRIGDVRLVIIDPITAYMGGGDANSTTDVRGALDPIANMAMCYLVAIVGVSHLNKSSAQTAIQRTSGSMAFVAAARSSQIVVKDRANPLRRLLLPQKYNIAKEGGGLAFSIKSVDMGNGIHTSSVEWEAEPVMLTADEAIRTDPDEANSMQEAKLFIAELLKDGPVKSTDAEKSCLEAGITWITIQRAKKALGVESKKEGKGQWKWSISKIIIGENTPPAQSDDNLDNLPMDTGFQPIEQAKKVKGYHPESVINIQKTDLATIAKIGSESSSNPTEKTPILEIY